MPAYPSMSRCCFRANSISRWAEAYLRGIERRIEAGLDPKVESVASIFVSRWDKAVAEKVPANLRNKLGIAVSQRIYKAYVDLLASSRIARLTEAGAHPQRLLWASTGTKDPALSDTLYIETLAAPDTVNTMPEKTLLAFADHGQVNGAMRIDGGDAEALLAEFTRAGIDLDALAMQLQQEGAEAFEKSLAEPVGRYRQQASEECVMSLGYDKLLYILPFDHRHSYVSGMFDFDGPLTQAQHDKIADSKHLIYEGFKLALATGLPKEACGILVDEEFGSAILRDAAHQQVITAMSTEKSGQAEFEFEYGEAFAEHIAAFNPTFCQGLGQLQRCGRPCAQSAPVAQP